MKHTRISARWFHLAPGRPLRFWINVSRIAKERRVGRNNIPKIRQIVREVRR